MTPDQLCKSGSEHSHQVALFAYCGYARLHGFDEADKWAAGGGTIQWNESMGVKVPELKWLHAIANGGSRGDDERSAKIRGAQLKAEGVKKGVADLFWPMPKRSYNARDDKWFFSYCGLYLEMKKPSQKPKRTGAGGVSEEQQEFGAYSQRVGYGWMVCYSWREAADAIRQYWEWGR